MSVPSPRMDLNVLALDSREQSVPYDAVLIPVRGKKLKQKRIPFLVSFKIMLKSARGRGVLAYKSTLVEQKWL